jgi:hypothetical protein
MLELVDTSITIIRNWSWCIINRLEIIHITLLHKCVHLQAMNPEVLVNFILTVMSACVISGADKMNTAAQNWLQHFLFLLLWRCITLILGALSCRARNRKMIKAWQRPGKVTERESPDHGIANAVLTGEYCEIVCSATMTL